VAERPLSRDGAAAAPAQGALSRPPVRGPAPPRLVAFDFDGTLVDSFPVFRTVFAEVAERFGLRRPAAAEAEALRGLPTRELLRRLDVPLARLPAILRDAQARMAHRAHAVAVVPGVPALLASLASRGVAVAVLSSNGEGLVRQVLGASLVAHVTAFRCGTALFGKAPRLRALVRRFRATGAAVFVGDEERDIAAARAAGVRALAVTWGYATPAALGDADAICENVASLAGALGLRPGDLPGVDGRG
jgi:phosphoglycolate phosphatase